MTIEVTFTPRNVTLPGVPVPAWLIKIAQKLPMISEPGVVWHYGDPLTEGRHQQADSQEGCLFSVSEHPEEWREIARLGGLPLWECTLPDEAQWVDVHGVSKRLWREIMSAALRLDLVTEVETFQAWNFDSDSEEYRFSEHLTLAAAQAEIDGDGSYTKKRMGFAPTPKLAAYWQARGREGASVELLSVNMAALAYLADWSGIAIGLWWNDDLDPDALSAPRGGIFQSQLAGLTFYRFESE